MKQISHEWWHKRQKDLHLMWCEIPSPIFRLDSPQAYWLDVGRKYAEFASLVEDLDQLLKSRTPDKRTGRRDLADLVENLTWFGEYLVLRCIGSEDREDVQLFLTSITYPEKFQRFQDDPERLLRYATDVRLAAESLAKGIYQYCEAMNDVIPRPYLPTLSRLADVEADLAEARDLTALGYEDTALFVLTRCLEGVLRKLQSQSKVIFDPADAVAVAKAESFDDLVKAVASAKLARTGEPLLSANMKAVAGSLRQSRNQLAHDDDLDDPFFGSSIKDLESLTVKILVAIDERLASVL